MLLEDEKTVERSAREIVDQDGPNPPAILGNARGGGGIE
jgi:hypothetical protein